MTKMDFSEFLRRDVRLVILRLLAEMPAYSANSSVLTMALERFGHSVSRDFVRGELTWLQEQGLVTIDDMEAVLVARLTERGQDVAAARVMVPGVARPRA